MLSWARDKGRAQEAIFSRMEGLGHQVPFLPSQTIPTQASDETGEGQDFTRFTVSPILSRTDMVLADWSWSSELLEFHRARSSMYGEDSRSSG